MLDFFRTWVFAHGLDFRRLAGFAILAAPAVGDGVGGDAHQPCTEGSAAPFEMLQVGESVMKHLGGDVLRGIAVAKAARDVGVDAVEVKLVEVAKARGILLRRFDKPPLAGFTDCFQLGLRLDWSGLVSHCALILKNCAAGERLRWSLKNFVKYSAILFGTPSGRVASDALRPWI